MPNSSSGRITNTICESEDSKILAVSNTILYVNNEPTDISAGHIDAAIEDNEISVLNTDRLPYISPGHTNRIEKFTKFLNPVFQLILVIFLFSGTISGLAQSTITPELTKEEQAWLDKKHAVRVRVGNRPPLVIHNPQPQGMAVDYLKIIAQQFDINFEYVADNEPWIEGFEDIAGDHLRFDLYLAATRTPERMQSHAMSEDYLHSPWVVFTRLETSNILSLEDLRGKKVAVEAGFPQHDMLKKDFPEIELVLVNLTEDALRAVSSGKADASMGNLMVCSYYIQRDGLSNLKVSTTTRYGVHSMGMATRKEWTPLISIINKGLASITEGQKTSIRNKYIQVRFEHGITAKDVTKWTLISLISVLGIIIFFAFYNRTLKTQIDKHTLKLTTSMEAFQLESQARKNVMEELTASEERFRGVFNSISDVFTRSDMKGNCMMVSPSIYDLIGYKPEEVLGKNLEDFYANPKQRNKVVEMLQKSKSVKNFEIDIIRKDGKTVTVSTNAKMYYNSEGEPLGVEGNIRDITERKLAEKKALISKAKYSDLVDNSLVGVFTTTLDGQFVFVNQAMGDMYEYDNADQMIADGSLGLWNDLKQREQMLLSLQKYGEVANFEAQTVTHTGRLIQVIFSAKKQGEQIMGMVMDITDRKKIEEKLRENEKNLKASQKMAQVGNWAWDVQTNILAWSEEVYRIYGIAPDTEVTYDRLIEVIHPEDQEYHNKQSTKWMQNKAVEPYDYRIITPDGLLKHVHAIANMEHDESGNPVRLAGTVQDITVLKQAESEHDKLFNSSFDLICIAGSDGYFKEINPYWEQVTGYSREELYSRPFSEFIHPDDVEKTTLEIRELLKGKRATIGFENRYIIKSGKEIHLSWTATLDPVENHMYCIARNITDRKMAEMKIIQYQQRLKGLANELTINEEKVRKQIAVDLHDHVGQLLASMRMQMAGIIDMEENPELTMRLKIISQGLLKSIQATRSAIFDLSPPQLNEIGLVAAIHDWMKEEIEQKHFIKTVISGENMEFRLDENTRFLLFRSLKELMMNTVKHAKASQLTMMFKRKTNMLEMTIEDDGIGFNYNPDLLRLKSDSYGLFSIQERISDLGGTMNVNSITDKGTKIKLAIPL